MSALEQVMDEFGIPYSERGECEDMAQEVMRLRAERDAAVRDLHEISQIVQGDKMLPVVVAVGSLRAKLEALTSHMNQVHEELGGTDTVLTIEAAQRVMARLAACERVVEAACTLADALQEVEETHATREPSDGERRHLMGIVSRATREIEFTVRDYRAAVSTGKGDA